MWRVFMALFAAILIPACHRDDDWRARLSFEVNEYGYSVHWGEQGSTTTVNPVTGQVYFTKADAYRWHKEAVDRAVNWFAVNYGLSYESLYSTAKNINWVLVDNCAFIASDDRTWALGEYLPGYWQVWAGVYRREPPGFNEGWPRSEIPYGTPPWTVNNAPWDYNIVRWGVIDSGNEYPALRHEFGHALFGACFEHNCQAIYY